MQKEHFIQADWPAPTQVKAYTTTRQSGFSQGAYASFNLALHVSDQQNNVLQNRQLLENLLQLKQQPFWLQQVHGTQCLPWSNSLSIVQSDASFSETLQQPCVVLTADCLPILIASKQGDWVAACHAGWRGLLAGVIQATLACYKQPTKNLIAWIGPAISQKYFEVGQEVYQALVNKNSQYASAFSKNPRGRYQLDMVALAKSIFNQFAVDCYGGNRCSYAEDALFYSYRRDGTTGRMASLIWLE